VEKILRSFLWNESELNGSGAKLAWKCGIKAAMLKHVWCGYVPIMVTPFGPATGYF
jgi:hypothetical protein